MTPDPPLKSLPSRPKLSSAGPMGPIPDPPPAPIRLPPPEKRPPALTFTDGLNFGCGFWIAGAVFFGAVGFGLVLLGILSRL